MSTRKTFLLKTLPVLVSGALFATVMHASAADKVLGSNLYDIVVGDFDGDQMSDVIRQGARRELEHSAILAAVQQADVQRWQDGFLDTVWNRDAAQLIVGDFNGDASADLLIQRNNPISVATVVHAYADGRLGVPVQAVGEWYLGLQWDAAHRRLLAADFNGDGRDDLFLQGHTDADRHALALAAADGTFTELASSFDNAHLNRSWSVANTTLATGDFDGNGRYELLLQPATGDADTLVVGADQTGALNHQQTVIPAQHLNLDWSSNRHRAVVGDFNGDGKDDVFLLAAHVVEQSAYVPSTGTSFERIDRVIDRIADLDQLKQVLVGDFDADGIDDLILLYQDPSLAPTVLLADAARAARLATFLRKLGILNQSQQLNVIDGRRPIATEDPLNEVSGASASPINTANSWPISSPLSATGKPTISKSAVAKATTYTPIAEPAWQEYGSSGGQFRVDETGAATFSLPIATAPGSGGVAPQLSLNYSSQGANGPLGAGWSVGGLSAISRCRATKEVDGIDGDITFSDNDKFCLDGRRLLDVPTQSSSGNWVYRTEIDSFAKVVAKGGSKGTPSYFELHRKDGSTSYFGETADSKVELVGGPNNNKAMSWSVNRFRDSVGNYLRFNYVELAGEHYLESVKAFGNNRSAHHSEIKFIYEPRPDIRKTYTYGGSIVSNKRVKEIQSLGDGKQVRRYKLTYNIGTNGVSQVHFLQECRDDTCLPAVKFNWRNQPYRFSNQTQSNNGSSFSHRFVTGRIADFNGDGRGDLAWLFRDSDWEYFWLNIWTERTGPNTDYFSPVSAGIPVKKNRLKSWHLLDYNGDGRSDVMLPMCTSETLLPLVNRYQCATWGGWAVVLANVDGSLPAPASGRWILPNKIDTKLPILNSEDSDLADFDGNGLPDLLYRGTGSNEIYVSLFEQAGRNGHTCANNAISSGNCFGTPRLVSLAISSPPPMNSDDESYVLTGVAVEGTDRPAIQTLDINGDSAADLIVEAKYLVSFYDDSGPEDHLAQREVIKKRILLSQLNRNSDRFEEATGYAVTLDSVLPQGEYSRFTDLNGDGLTDLLRSQNTLWWAHINTGTSYVVSGASVSGIPSTSNERLQTFDMDSDGLSDLVYPESQRYKVRYQNADGTFADAIDAGAYAEAASDRTDLFGDFNGDGKIDKVELFHDYDGTENHHGQRIQLFDSSFVANSVIDEIRLPSGATTSIEYSPLTNTNIYSQGTPLTRTSGRGSTVLNVLAPMYVVSRVASSSPEAGAAPQAVNNTAKAAVKYRYVGLKVQAGGRGSLGFQQLITTDEQTGVETTTSYEQAFPFTGLPISTVKKRAGITLSESINTLTTYSARYGGSTFLEGDFPLVVTSLDRQRDINGDDTTSFLSHVVTQTEYDRYGNVSKLTVSNKNGWLSSANLQVKTTENSYGTTSDEGFYGRLSWSTVKTERPGLAAETRTSQFKYGDYRQLTEEIIEPNGDERTYLRTVYQFDTFGNRRKTTTCSLHVTNCGNDNTQQPNNPLYINRSARAEHDSEGRFVVKKYNHYDQLVEELISWHDTYQPTQVRGPTGIIKTLQYTPFGRLWRESDNTGSIGTWSEQYMESCSAVSCVLGAVYRVEKRSSGAPTSYQYFDVLGREVAVQVDSLTQRASGYLTKYTEYDVLSRVKRVSVPHFSHSAVPGWTESEYDNLGRTTRITLPHAPSKPVTISYLGLTTTRVNELGQRKVEQRNALGELVSVTDNDAGAGVERAVITYQYDTQGQLAKLSRANSNSLQSQLGYDLRGRKISMWDADKSLGGGAWTYTYNAVGELVSQVDARGYITQNRYDALGRLVARTESSNTGVVLSSAGWSYDTAANKPGLLLSDSATVLLSESGSATPYTRTYRYDSLGRPIGIEHLFEGRTTPYVESTEYDPVDGRVVVKRDITGKGLRYVYSASHYLNEVQDADNSSIVFQRIQEMDAHGNITRESLGNGAVVTRQFNPLTGRLSDIATNRGANLQNLHYEWDEIGNLTLRRDTSAGKYVEESFTYDGLNRLRRAYAGASDKEVTTTYDAEGNIQTKSDVASGAYAYGQACNGITAGPHALSSVVTTSGTKTYCYDKNGNMVSGDGRTLTYDNTFDLPTKIVGGNHTAFYSYGIDRARFKRVDRKTGEAESVVWYVGSVEIVKKTDGSTEFRRAIPNGLVTNGTPTYILKDHIGSTDVILDCTGKVIEAHSFDAWGKQRNVDTWKLRGGMWAATWPTEMLPKSPMLSPRTSAKTFRGFTGHEMVDELGLIHMNGRMYDPHLGRFLQADPLIQAPTMSQSLNRYSYVINNPLSGTDPSGFSWWMDKGRKNIGTIVAIVVTWLCSGTCGAWTAAWVAASQAAVTYLQTGSTSAAFKAGVTAYASAMLFNAIGEAFSTCQSCAVSTFGTELSPTAFASKVVAHGMAGGVMSVVQGGKFGHGFASAAVNAIFSGKIDSLDSGNQGISLVRAFTSAIVGGTASVMSGGKFSNGAFTAAMARMFNDDGRHGNGRDRLPKGGTWEQRSGRFEQVLAANPSNRALIWDQGSGGWMLFEGNTVIRVGYSYAGGEKGAEPSAVNNPLTETVKDTGPAPKGTYIAEQYTRANGQMWVRMWPSPENTMYGRDHFNIHGDAPPLFDASNGCPIMQLQDRQNITTGTLIFVQ